MSHVTTFVRFTINPTHTEKLLKAYLVRFETPSVSVASMLIVALVRGERIYQELEEHYAMDYSIDFPKTASAEVMVVDRPTSSKCQHARRNAFSTL